MATRLGRELAGGHDLGGYRRGRPAAQELKAMSMRLSSIVLGFLAACTPAAAPAGSPGGSSSGPTLEAERRAVLEELIAVDTSHGHETDALRPIARRFEDAGLHAE